MAMPQKIRSSGVNSFHQSFMPALLAQGGKQGKSRAPTICGGELYRGCPDAPGSHALANELLAPSHRVRIPAPHPMKIGRKNCVRLLFWSEPSFDEPGLKPEGTFKAAEEAHGEKSGAGRPRGVDRPL